jgi:hypothetical protein
MRKTTATVKRVAVVEHALVVRDVVAIVTAEAAANATVVIFNAGTKRKPNRLLN